MLAQVLYGLPLNVTGRIMGPSETRRPATDPVLVVIVKDVRLERGEALFANLTTNLPDAVNIRDPWRKMIRPRAVGHAVRPIDPNLVADFSAEKSVARNIESFGLHVEECVLNRAKRLSDDTARSGPCAIT
jgi:hypothetical protein